MSRLRETLQQKAGHQLEQQANSNKKGSLHKSSHKKTKKNRKY